MRLPSILAALAFTSLVALADAPAPAIPIDQAVKLATDHLTERGLAGQHYIASLTLEDSAVTGGKRYWFARWMPSIKVEDKFESGLKIEMDGSLSRLTSSTRGGGRPDQEGVRRVGARSIR